MAQSLIMKDERAGSFLFYVTVLALLVVFIGDSPYYQSTQARVQSGANNLVRQGILAAFLLFAVIPAIWQPGLVVRHVRHAWPVFIAGLLVITSVLWSQFPSLSLIRALSFEIMLVSAFWITILNKPEHRLSAWHAGLLGIIIVDALSFLVVPEWTLDHEGRFKGIHSHKNELGVIMSLAIFVFLDHWIRYRRTITVFAGILALIMLLASASKTSIALTFLLVPVFLILHLDRRQAFNVTMLFIAVGLTLVTAVTLSDALGLWGMKLDDLWQRETFTNRTLLWEYARFKISQQPLLGYGFGGFWGTDPVRALAFHDASDFVRQFGQAHNGYLGIALELGLTGLAFWLLVLATALKTSITQLSTRQPDAPLVFVVLVYCLLHNMFERSFFVAMSPLWFALIFVLLHLFQNREKSQ
jgi:O-antigen ligase